MADESTEGHPEAIGPYRILEKIGEGGMADVYLAEQAEPVKRFVALKILKAGMDSRQIVARFESERKALALLDHPNIAKIFDGGLAGDGRPFFIMEYVEGKPITQFCDEGRLSAAERIRIFIDVCRAVQHAHVKGLIHRDLKPSNILVGLVDGVPLPRIIDFGISKATELEMADTAMQTRVGQIVGTPHYMSPEQVDIAGGDIDTRADIYSLGVVLYELLAGALPLDLSAVRDAAFRWAILEKIPPKPSTRFTSLDATKDEVAKARGTSPAELGRQLKGDLDWIVMKAIEKDRTRRFETANAFAMDCQRYLNHEPVFARPPDAGYLLRRFVRRNRAIVGAAAVALVAVVAGAVTATVGFLQASESEKIARQEAETANQVSEFLVDLFEVSDPENARGDTISAREVLDRGVVALNEDLADQPAVRAALLTTMGSVYINLGLFDEAEKLLREALEIRTQLVGEDDPATLTTASWLGKVLLEQDRYEEAIALETKTLAMRRRVLGDKHPSTLVSISNLAVQHRNTSKLDVAEPLYIEALAGQREVLGDEHHQTLLTINNLGALYHAQGRHEEARVLLEEAAETQDRVAGADHPQTLIAMNSLADLYYDMGQFDLAEPLNVAILERRKRVLGPDHVQTLWSMDRLAGVYAAQGRLEEAEPLHLAATEGLRSVHGPEHKNTLASMTNLAGLYRYMERFDEAEAVMVEVLDTQLRVGPADISTGITSHNLANLYRDTDRFEDAERMFEQAEQIWSESLPSDHPYFAVNNTEWAALKRVTGDEAGAAELEAKIPPSN